MFTFAHSRVLLPPEGDVACGHFEPWSGGLRAATKSILDQQNLLWFVTSEAGRSALPRQLRKRASVGLEQPMRVFEHKPLPQRTPSHQLLGRGCPSSDPEQQVRFRDF